MRLSFPGEAREAPPAAASATQLAANSENAQKYPPAPPPTVCLPGDDAALHQSLILSYEKLFCPVGPEECGLVQSIADIRIPGLHMALLNRGGGGSATKNTFATRAPGSPPRPPPR